MMITLYDKATGDYIADLSDAETPRPRDIIVIDETSYVVLDHAERRYVQGQLVGVSLRVALY